MIARARYMVLMLSICAFTPAVAQDAALLKDLTTVIALLGLPCGQVLSARRQAENDHIASCKNGNRYRVFVDANGRAAAKKQ